MTIEQELIKAQAEASAACQDLAEAQSTVEAVKADLATARQTIQTITTERDRLTAAVTKLEAEATQRETDHQAALLAKDADVEKRANLRANEIARAQGVAPVRDDQTVNRQSGDIAAQLATITDPVKRANFVRDNLPAIKAAARVQCLN